VTGWRPDVELLEGVRRTVAFFQANADLLPRSGYVK
jgi:hypothetical protein